MLKINGELFVTVGVCKQLCLIENLAREIKIELLIIWISLQKIRLGYENQYLSP